MRKVLIDDCDLFLARKDKKYYGHIHGREFIAMGNARKIVSKLTELLRKGIVGVYSQDYIMGDDFFISFNR